MESLKSRIYGHKVTLVRELNLHDEFLRIMLDKGVIDMPEFGQLQQFPESKDRNKLFLEILTRKTDHHVYVQFIGCLQHSGQTRLANLLTDVGEEMAILSELQIDLESRVKQVGEFLAVEERRAGIYLTEPPPDDDEGKPATTETEIWRKVEDSMKKSQQQLKRFQIDLDSRVKQVGEFLAVEERRAGIYLTEPPPDDDEVQIDLDSRVKQVGEFLAVEERRAGIYLTEPPPDDDEGKPATTETEIWKKVEDSMKKSQQQLKRCQAVINKLHKDCETVAKQNNEILDHTRECDAKMREVLRVGRKSAKQSAIPKKTSELFSNLMDDIEKLVKTRRRVLDMESEGKRHSTRIVRQCRDWLEGRVQALHQLQNHPNTESESATANGQVTQVNVNRVNPHDSDIAIVTILESLKLLEKELLEYIQQEITITEKYRQQLRARRLQKKVHGFNMEGLTDMDSMLQKATKEPESLKENVSMLKSYVKEINREYGECVFYLNKIVPQEAEQPPNGMLPTIHTSPKIVRKEGKPLVREWPGNMKRKPQLGGKSSRSVDSDLNMVGKPQNAPNQLLHKIKAMATMYEELKAEDLNLSSKYRIELAKKKRDMDIVMQKKDDQIMKLQTELKEVMAEKEKYKKLYNDTKIGFQRNVENSGTPRN